MCHTVTDRRQSMSETGYRLLRDPRRNRGTAFGADQRRSLGIEGLLPPHSTTLSSQVARIHGELSNLHEDINKYLLLSDLQARNETLYYATIMSDPAHFMPLVYTPTVGEACQKFDHIFRAARGLYLPYSAKGRLRELIGNWPVDDVRFIVVTDGERILGLGDLGVNGMGIPIGKLALYTACAGVPPELCLPITLDVGTNNPTYLDDPLYLGERHERVRGEDYHDFIEEFVTATLERFPLACMQWEDFANFNAVPILAKYRDRICTYNDDIQGTAAVALAGIYAALHITGGKLPEQKVLFLGAGSASTGIAGLIAQAMTKEGLSIEEARVRNILFDVNGLLTKDREDLADFQKPFAVDHAPVETFVDAIRAFRPTAIVGVSTVPKLFSQQVIEAMSEINERPIIFPYSNPTSRSECTAEEAYRWSKGQAVFASGSPFDPVEYEGRTFVPGQGNNVYIFPAMGMAIYATQAKRVTDDMFITAARAIAEQVDAASLEKGLIYPPQSDILEASTVAAIKVAEDIFDQGLARLPKPDDVARHIRDSAYRPAYRD
ncbi:NAD-dependent malic enzyme [Endobacter medicaginis]|nr:NAD-dependent malic enzyme [Endobacter medicaginis]MCX5475882.1 NAD-dependent malic enzyme [Endobacter medicaginis]